MTATTTKTKPAPKGKAPKTARKAKVSTKKAARSAARTRVSEPRKGTMTVKILALAQRPQGVSREELNKLTEWTGAPWKWNFSNPQGTGYCDRFGYTLKITEGKDGETRYHVRKK